MFKIQVSKSVLGAVESSPLGIARLEVLASLKLCSMPTLKTTLSRLNKAGKIIRLKRGAYSASPMRDAYACAQAVFAGYIGFAAALHVHGIISEMPFTVAVVTAGGSKVKRFGQYEFRAVALGEKAVGFEKKDGRVVSTAAKTLFDCIYAPEYSVERERLIGAYRDRGMKREEWEEFDAYVGKFASAKMARRMQRAKEEIWV